ncbi:MAG: ATP-binding protein [Chitinophagaceae bacterium]
MIKFIKLLFLLLAGGNCISQTFEKIDSLKVLLAKTNSDTARALIMGDISLLFTFINNDSCKHYAQKGLELSNKINFIKGIARNLYGLGGANLTEGKDPQALNLFLRGHELAETHNFPYEDGWCLSGIGNVYQDLKDFPKAIGYYQKGNQAVAGLHLQSEILEVKQQLDLAIGICYTESGQLDSAKHYLDKAFSEVAYPESHNELYFFYSALHQKLGNNDSALWYIKRAIALTDKRDPYGVADCNLIAAGYYKNMMQSDSAIYYAQVSFHAAQVMSYKSSMLKSAALLAALWESIDIKKSSQFYKQVIALNDELYGAKKVKELQRIDTEEQERFRKIEADRIAYNNRLKQYAFLSGLVVLLIIAYLLYRNNLKEKKAKSQLQGKNKVIEQTLYNLKSTQQQLIQSEKMASLGELTAGIAHEIQNPLNFVNNFSEVSRELIDELKNQKEKLKKEEQEEILNDLDINLEKINHHGKRADAIVKGMLQHSQKSSGEKNLTDINVLADEYLRLSYHGLRSKEKSFNATLKTGFDENIGKIKIVPQDIGRVLLNLYNNAFYAVNEKAASFKLQAMSYEPIISVTTKRQSNNITITIEDNGTGIPKSIVDKIFQPFFTTKPTGSGTGLGLSLAYDIIKAHGGEIKVETKEKEGTTFIIQLPASNA